MTSTNPVEPELDPTTETPPDNAGSPDTACPNCSGSGMLDDGTPCLHCEGTGKRVSGVRPA